MKRHFNRHIDGIDLDFWHTLIERFGHPLTLNRGEYLCRCGEITNVIGYVKSGYLIYNVDGVNKIGGFTFPGALFGDYPNCLYNHPARFNIMAGRKTDVWVMDATQLPCLYTTDPVISRHGHRFAESVYNSLISRFRSILCETTLERYQELLRMHPQIEQDVTQKEIAEYLQISPVHLCRLRKEILNLGKEILNK